LPRQLVVTIGPRSAPLASALANAGATAFRLNTSHLEVVAVEALVTDLRRAAPGLPLVLDLQGAKMRVGHGAARSLVADERVTLALEPSSAAEVHVPHAELFSAVHPGELVQLDDARLRLRVESVAAGRLVARVEQAGTLAPRKGINVVDHPVVATGLSSKDAALARLAAGLEDCALAYSFMVDGREAAWLRALAPRARVIGKVERREATVALAQLATLVDVVWVCRGDLGAQLGMPGLAEFVAALAPDRLGCPVLMAGQVLEHLTRAAQPTRSEVCHLFDLLARGYAGIVLSDETAVGDDPRAAVEVAALLLRTL